MNRKRSIYKVFFYTLIVFLLIFGGSRSYRYMFRKTIGKIDIETESSMQTANNSDYIIGGSTNYLLVPNQPRSSIDICIKPHVLNLKSKGEIVISMIRLPGEYDPHDIDSDSLELSVLFCPKCESIYPTSHRPLHGKYSAYFSRQDLIDKIESMDMDLPTNLNLKIYGEMNDGTPFEGLETVWIIKQK